MTKELEALKRIRKLLEDKYGLLIYVDDLDIIETALKEYEGAKKHIEALNKERIDSALKLKALEIIKKKRVNLEYLKCCENYEQYKTICSYFNEINQEEYDLLKEVVEHGAL